MKAAYKRSAQARKDRTKDPAGDEPLHPAILQLLDCALSNIGEKLKERPQEDCNKAKEEAKNALESAPKRLRAA